MCEETKKLENIELTDEQMETVAGGETTTDALLPWVQQIGPNSDEKNQIPITKPVTS